MGVQQQQSQCNTTLYYWCTKSMSDKMMGAPPSYDPNPPPGVPMMAPSAPPVVVVHQVQPQPYIKPIFGTNPCRLTCQYCNQQVVTAVERKFSMLGWMVAGGICIVGLWPCCCIPCCLDTFYDYEHTCPSCNAIVGNKKAGWGVGVGRDQRSL